METKTYIDSMQLKLKNGESTAEQLKTYYHFLCENSEAVKEVILGKLNNSPKYKRKHKKTKDELMKQIYSNMFEDLVYNIQETFSYQMDFSDIEGSRQKAIEKIINSATDEKLQARAAKRKADQEERDGRKQEIISAIQNPQTLEDFSLLFQYRKTPMTPEEQERYDYLFAIDEKEKREKQSEVISLSNNMYTVIADKDTRDNSDLWVVKLNNRVERDEFNRISASMKTINGYYSRFKSGFIFKYDPSSALLGEEIPEQKHLSNSDKLRKLADNMQNTIDDRRRDRQTNTARRARMAASVAADADSLERTQAVIRNIANAMDNNELKLINKIDSRTQIDTLERILGTANWKKSKVENINYNVWRELPLTADVIQYAEIPSSNIYLRQLQSIINDIKHTDGFKLIANRLQKLINSASITDQDHDPLVDITGYEDEIDKIYKKTDVLENQYFETAVEERRRLTRMGIESVEELRAYLREYFNYRKVKSSITPEQRKIKELEMQYKLQQKGDINFTPVNVVAQMIELADIDNNSKILEPSAGIGNIADQVKQYTSNIDVCEFMYGFRELLQLKGHNVVGSDFMEFNKYDYYNVIIMNPPFSAEQEHIKHAYDLLTLGGKLIAITSPHWTFANDSKEFRNWFEEMNGEIVEELDGGTFEMTGVRSQIVIINKEEAMQEVI